MTTTPVRTQRLQRGWTLSQLAEQCAAAGATTAVSNLHRIESGSQVPRPGLRVALAKVLGLKLTDGEWADAQNTQNRRPANAPTEQQAAATEAGQAAESEGAKGRQQRRTEAEVAVLS